MQLNELSARELALIDSVCLEFETAVRGGQPMRIETAVELYHSQYQGTPPPEHVDLLREELSAIEQELRSGATADEQETQWRPAEVVAGSRNLQSSGPFASDTRSTSSLNPPPATDRDATAGNATDRDDGGASWQPGNLIGPYRIESVLARGGMGVVYRAFDTRLDRTVAIKMMGFHELSLSDPKRRDLVERFEREAKAVAALSHPNIVELFDVGVQRNSPYAVMEYLDGVTLADRLRSGALSVEQTRQIGLQIAGALATAHAAGVIHRDLKPHNVILVDSSNLGQEIEFRVKLVDFGLSRVSDSLLHDDEPGSGKTRAGTILGTPGYMSPEQARGESATGAADMFGFGCLLYEAFFGKPAIPGDTPADRLAGTLRGDVTYEAGGCEKSKTLCRLIAECLNKEIQSRPTAGDVYARLRQFDLQTAPTNLIPVTGPPAAVKTVQTEPPRLLRRHALAAMTGGVLGGIGGVLSFETPSIGLDSIRSLAVLTIQPAAEANAGAVHSGIPLAEKPISDGDMLASALVNELTAVDGLAVMPYRPLSAHSPGDYEKLGGELEVDAFLTGTYENQNVGKENFWVFNWELISGKDGRLLAGDRFVAKQSTDDDPLLARSGVAAEVAGKIGRFLITSGQKNQPPNSHAYGCLAKGHAYADADSVAGLRQAIHCFSKAHQEDPRLSQPLGARAVAAMNLAARSDAEEALRNLEIATESMIKALKIAPQSVSGRLAKAMLEWQRFHHFEDAYDIFSQLDQDAKYNWQVQHQRGLLLAALGRGDEAVDALRRASKLNPMSILVKSDRCRVDWFFQDEPRAIAEARRYFESMGDDNPGKSLMAGLLIDLHEQRGDITAAARLQSLTPEPRTRQRYFQARATTLARIPYGPFGTELNAAILKLRAGAQADPQWLWKLDESGATMFPLLLARHPAFAGLRSLRQASDFLPRQAVRGRWS